MDTILKNECYFLENQYKSISKKVSLVLYCGKYLFFCYLRLDRFFYKANPYHGGHGLDSRSRRFISWNCLRCLYNWDDLLCP